MNWLRVLMVALALLAAGNSALADEPPALSKGQTLYLPVYTFVWHGNLDKERKPEKSPVSILVSIRNTDPARPVKLLSAKYYSTAGKLLAEYVPQPKAIGPMGTYELYVERKEMAGGSGANFVIEWQADVPVNPLLVEGVHADIQGHRTLAFTTRATPIVVGN